MTNPFDDDRPQLPATEPASMPTDVDMPRRQDGGTTIDFAPLVDMAQLLRRDEADLLKRAEWVGALMGDSAYYDFPMGGTRITGASIVLAEALAGEWGAIAHEMTIVSANPLPSGGQRVHLRARVIDLKRVVIGVADAVVSTAPPPGKFRDSQEQSERWHSMQIQSAGSKIKRNAILDVLPGWFVQISLKAAMEADDRSVLNRGGRTRTVAEAASDTIRAYADIGLTQEHLEAVTGHPVTLWTVRQLRQLRELWREITSGNATAASVIASLAGPDGASAAEDLGIAPQAIADHGDLPHELDGIDPREDTRERVPVEPAQAPAEEPAEEPAASSPPDTAPSIDELKTACAALEARLPPVVVTEVRQEQGISLDGRPITSWRGGPQAAALYHSQLEREVQGVEADEEERAALVEEGSPAGGNGGMEGW